MTVTITLRCFTLCPVLTFSRLPLSHSLLLTASTIELTPDNLQPLTSARPRNIVHHVLVFANASRFLCHFYSVVNVALSQSHCMHHLDVVHIAVVLYSSVRHTP